MKYYFIVNPRSSSGKGRKIWECARQKLAADKTDYQVFFTGRPGHAGELAGRISSSFAPCTIVAVGGDGTANEVVNGLTNIDQIRFGYIPTGSGNDLARTLALSSDPEKAVETVLHPRRICPVNIGVCRMEGRTRRFLVSAGIGFDAAVCYEAMRSGIKNFLNRLGLGKLTYLLIALKQLLLMRPCSAEISVDGGAPTPYSGILFAAAMNAKYEGGGFMFCPDADVSDDILDVCLVEKMPKLKILALLPTAFFGKHTKYKGIHILRCKTLSVAVQRPLAVHTDGESDAFYPSMEISLCEKKLPFIVG